MGRQRHWVQEQVMQAIVDHVRTGSPVLLDAATIAQQLQCPSPDVTRTLRRCAREGLLTIQDEVGQDNPSVLRLTHLGRQWVQHRLGTQHAP